MPDELPEPGQVEEVPGLRGVKSTPRSQVWQRDLVEEGCHIVEVECDGGVRILIVGVELWACHRGCVRD